MNGMPQHCYQGNTMGRFERKTVLITGGAAGIGLAAAQCFVREGGCVTLVDIDEGALRQAADSLGPAATYYVADVSDARQTKEYVAHSMSRNERIDVALLNAGIEGPIAPMDETDIEDFDRVMAVNVRSAWLALASLLPLMRRQGGGSIVMTSSISGLRGTAGQGAYVASKHALVGLMKTAALEGAPHGIRVNAVCPAPVQTRMIEALENGFNSASPEDARKMILSGIPLNRYAAAGEIANLIAYLASDEAGFCTGAAYPVDGGASAGPARHIQKS